MEVTEAGVVLKELPGTEEPRAERDVAGVGVVEILRHVGNPRVVKNAENPGKEDKDKSGEQRGGGEDERASDAIARGGSGEQKIEEDDGDEKRGGDGRGLEFGHRHGAEAETGEDPAPGAGPTIGAEQVGDGKPEAGGEQGDGNVFARVVDEIGRGGEGDESDGGKDRDAGQRFTAQQGERAVACDEGDSHEEEAEDADAEIVEFQADEREEQQRIDVQRAVGRAIDGAPEDGIVLEGDRLGDVLALVDVEVAIDEKNRPAKCEEGGGESEEEEPGRELALETAFGKFGDGAGEGGDGGDECEGGERAPRDPPESSGIGVEPGQHGGHGSERRGQVEPGAGGVRRGRRFRRGWRRVGGLRLPGPETGGFGVIEDDPRKIERARGWCRRRRDARRSVDRTTR